MKARARVAWKVLIALLALTLLALTPWALADEAPPRDWFRVIALDRVTYAISEPKYWQENVSYLLIGSSSALLFDTGPGVYSMGPVVKSLTQLPITVIPSHLHFDHIGRIREFPRIALLDNPVLRQEMQGDVLTLTAAQCLLQDPSSFRVTRWLADGEVIDLGGRQISILSTPGHTPDSVTLLDSSRRWMFTGDLLNRGGTLYDVPGSNLQSVSASLRHLRTLAHRGYTAHEAHSERPIPPALFLRTSDSVLEAIGRPGGGKPVCLDGVPARELDVNGFVVVLPSTTDERLRPLSSSIVEIDWRKQPCPST